MNKKIKMNKFVSACLGVTTALWLSGAVMLVPTTAHADVMDDLQAQITFLLSQIATLQAQLAEIDGTATSETCGYTFSDNLSLGNTGNDVLNLQTVLNSDVDTQVASTGVGSAGNETDYFGPLTKAAVVKFQDKYSSEVLAPVGLSNGTGYVGPSTRAKLNSFYGECPIIPDPVDDEPVVISPTVDITLSLDNPVSQILPNNGINIEFLRFDTNVFLDDLTLAHRGLGNSSEFDSISVWVNGFNVGTKTGFSSNNEVKFRNLDIDAGSVISIRVDLNASIGNQHYVEVVSTHPEVSGSPLKGNVMSIAGSLLHSITLVSYSVDESSVVAGESDIQLSNFRVKVPLASSTDIVIKSIQLENLGNTDIFNLRMIVDGKNYQGIINSDDQILFSNLDIEIEERRSKTFEVYGDIDSDVYGESTVLIGLNNINAVDINGFNVKVDGELNSGTIDVGTTGTLELSEDSNLETQVVLLGDIDKTILGFTIEQNGEDFDLETVVIDGLDTDVVEKVHLYQGTSKIASEDVFNSEITFDTNYRITSDTDFTVRADFYELKDAAVLELKLTPEVVKITGLGVNSDEILTVNGFDGEDTYVYASYPEISRTDSLPSILPPTELDVLELTVKAIGGDIRLASTTDAFVFDISSYGMPEELSYKVFVDGNEYAAGTIEGDADEFAVALAYDNEELVINEGNSKRITFEFDFSNSDTTRGFRMTLADDESAVNWLSEDNDENYQLINSVENTLDLPIKSTQFYREGN